MWKNYLKHKNGYLRKFLECQWNNLQELAKEDFNLSSEEEIKNRYSEMESFLQNRKTSAGIIYNILNFLDVTPLSSSKIKEQIRSASEFDYKDFYRLHNIYKKINTGQYLFSDLVFKIAVKKYAKMKKVSKEEIFESMQMRCDKNVNKEILALDNMIDKKEVEKANEVVAENLIKLLKTEHVLNDKKRKKTVQDFINVQLQINEQHDTLGL